MRGRAALMSSAKSDWGTPAWLLRSLEAELGQPFALDLAARADNKVAPLWVGPGSRYGENTLDPELPHRLLTELPPGLWGRWWFCNPPYGKDTLAWVRAWERLVAHGARIVALMPARTDTRWFHAIRPSFATEIRLLQGRLQFVGAPNGAPFPSMLAFMAQSVGTPAPELRITRRTYHAPRETTNP